MFYVVCVCVCVCVSVCVCDVCECLCVMFVHDVYLACSLVMCDVCVMRISVSCEYVLFVCVCVIGVHVLERYYGIFVIV